MFLGRAAQRQTKGSDQGDFAIKFWFFLRTQLQANATCRGDPFEHHQRVSRILGVFQTGDDQEVKRAKASGPDKKTAE